MIVPIKNENMRLIVLLFTLAFTSIVFGQEAVIGFYEDGNGRHNISVRLKDDGRKIDCAFVSVSSTMGNGYFRIDNKKIPEFVAALTEVKSKYEEWSEQASRNKVKSFTKSISAKFPKVVTYLSDKADFNFTQSPQALFEVKDGISCVWISTSTSTNFTKYTNKKVVFAMLFKRPSDIDGLISLLGNEENLLQITCDKIKSKSEIDNLFR